MKLEELKKIASKATPRPWFEAITSEDTKFIAAAANHIDALLAVAEAAKDALCFINNTSDSAIRLREAVEKLEAIE